MNSQAISLETTFNQCHEHLREMDKNRDRLIEFYLLLVAALLTAVTTGKLEASAGSVLCGFVFFLGLFLAESVTQYRLWHTRYSYTAGLLQALSRSENPTETENYMRLLGQKGLGIYDGQGFDKNHRRRYLPWLWCQIRQMPGTEAATFQASLLITAVPLYLWIGIPPTAPYIAICSIMLYLVVANLWSAFYLYEKYVECPWATWLLDGLDPNRDFRHQQKRDSQKNANRGPTGK